MSGAAGTGHVFPEGTADCHVHIYGPFDKYPEVPISEYKSPDAPVERLLALWDGLGIARGVIVHARSAGRDGQVTLDALKAHPDRLRGVAVFEDEVTDARLDEMTEAGFRGVRINMMQLDGKRLYQGGMGLEDLARLAPRLAERGWHAQIWAESGDIVALAPELMRLPLDFVIDHQGRTPATRGVGYAGFQAMLDLLKTGRWWCKISGSDRNTALGPPYADSAAFMAALVETAPERLVWGTDWPHVGHSDETRPEMADLVARLFETVSDPEIRRRILVENPRTLYGF
ncbi:Predicted metal-dependent hydrolase, TIM-barrel fold [Albimonas donghaensis]|uniref:Predicted metal-dependent hydrolase, TIM-barrel fold n=1 Tax=Albimonas donghaensis TaxID=356660 RepID=A0A1H2RVR4_9RHOB|nr:amidohydrolase family protein [Albimonas donghaensis]SDW23571.1 Predicted metal-dependent hydrolase, TIM-barrel fold [Albimonas donghaensis]